MSPQEEFHAKLSGKGEIYFTPAFFQEVKEIQQQAVEEALRSPELIEALQQPPSLYWKDIRDYDLSEARKNFRINDFPDEGDIVLVKSYTGKAEIKFDSPNADSFDLETYKKIKHTYTDIYLTNEAQEDATIKILFGRGDWELQETVPEIDLQGKIRNDYLEPITNPLNIGQIIEDGHIKPHANIGCEKILVYGNTRLDKWRHPSDFTYIDGGYIYTHSILADALSVAQLSAIAANVGTLTAGLIKSTDGKTLFDLTNGFMSVSDGVYTRFKAGKLNGDYGMETRDINGNLTIEEGSIVRALIKDVVAIGWGGNNVDITSDGWADLADMTLGPISLPKGTVMLIAKNMVKVKSKTGAAAKFTSMLAVRINTIDYAEVDMTTHLVDRQDSLVTIYSRNLDAGTYTFKARWKAAADIDTVTFTSLARSLIYLYWERP